MNIRDRYDREPVLRHIVDSMTQVLLCGDLTPHDLAHAATLAATIYAERYSVPVQIVFLPDGGSRITTLADKIRAEFLARLNLDHDSSTGGK